MNSHKQKIQKDLDAGKYYKICSNETTFKEYVFKIIDETEKQAQSEMSKSLVKWAESRMKRDIEDRIEEDGDIMVYDLALNDLIDYLK